MDKAVETVDKRGAAEPAGFGGVGIFAKEPLPGQVKTRLCPPLSPQEAALVYHTCLQETVAVMAAAGFAPVLFHTGDGAFFRRAFPGMRLFPQGAGDLGERMERALRTLLAENKAAVLIGSDSPDLPPALVEEAFTLLRQADAVISPARDGGYVLVGERRHSPELFRDIPWSTAGVRAATRRQAASARVDLREIDGWDDVDDLPSLRRLVARSPATATARLVRSRLLCHLR